MVFLLLLIIFISISLNLFFFSSQFYSYSVLPHEISNINIWMLLLESLISHCYLYILTIFHYLSTPNLKIVSNLCSSQQNHMFMPLIHLFLSKFSKLLLILVYVYPLQYIINLLNHYPNSNYPHYFCVLNCSDQPQLYHHSHFYHYHYYF